LAIVGAATCVIELAAEGADGRGWCTSRKRANGGGAFLNK
jgi:hypothetical protein